MIANAFKAFNTFYLIGILVHLKSTFLLVAAEGVLMKKNSDTVIVTSSIPYIHQIKS